MYLGQQPAPQSTVLQQEHRQHPPENAREQRGEVKGGLEGRVEHLENLCCSMNAQTLEAFQDFKNELLQRMSAQEEKSIELIQKLEKQEQRMKEEEEALESRRQEL